MKRVFEHPPAPTDGKRYWRGPGELNDTPEFREWLEREFPRGVAQLEADELSRRSFLKLMGASMALAGLGLSSCRRPEYHIVPFTKSAEWTIPGKALYYATAMPRRGGAIPLVATTMDGRPIKIEGNPLHPASGGATDAFAQASVLDLYDPVRSKRYIRREKIDGSDTKGRTSNRGEWEQYLAELLPRLGANGGAGVAVLAEEPHSPTRDRLRAELEGRLPGIRWCHYDPLAGDAQAAAAAGFGANARLTPRFDRADVILALDSDFVDCSEGDITSARAFASRRRVTAPKDNMNRLYVVENRYSLTGAMADHRLRLPASQIGAFAQALAARIGAGTGNAALGGLTAAPAAGGTPQWDERWLNECAADLVRAGGSSLVVCGPMQPTAVQLLVHGINAALGNIGTTQVVRDIPRNPRTIGIQQLAAEINNGTIQQLIILGGDPVYNAPRGLVEDRETRRLLDWEELQRRVPEVIRLGYHEDATSASSHWHIPMAHFLESWGDALTPEGDYVTIQPMILPLFGGVSELQLLNDLLGNPFVEGPELVRGTFGTLGVPGEPEEAWTRMLRDGFAAGLPTRERPGAFNAGAAGGFITQNWSSAPAPTADSPEIVFVRSYQTDDGRYINNGWLQEMPDPITKLAWDNAALVSPGYAKHLNVKNGDMIEITVSEPARAGGGEATQRQLQAAVLIAPGHVDNSITIPLGYGRRVGEYGPLPFSGGAVDEQPTTGDASGFNAYLLRSANTPHFVVADGRAVQSVRVQKIAGTYEFAITQEHFSIEGRGLVREATLDRYRQDPLFVKKIGGDDHLPPKLPSIYSPPQMDAPHQWGMAIDLNTCTGCSACVVACHAENNVPIVGKLQVRLGRSMHWLRIDRYFADERPFNQDRGEFPSDPEVVHQPMLCQHCENAPCETVCPVNATVHSEDGLNVMAYNRCIGTRYCANNCPFKVRRFNYFDYNQRPVGKKTIAGNFGVHQEFLGPLTKKGAPDTMKLQKNPNVTVRMRGVMEKCTFCVQRIQEAKIAAQVKAGPSPDKLIPRDSFTTACAQACPTDAIVFGNIADPESRVSQMKAQDRNYRLLEYLNVRTRASYLARIRNPNPAMPDAHQIGIASPIDSHDHAPGGDHGGHSYDQHNPGTLNPDPDKPKQPVAGEHPEE
jgi:MoCo/4Fe-4S cofactor protein with predicted Tat translocation signal